MNSSSLNQDNCTIRCRKKLKTNSAPVCWKWKSSRVMSVDTRADNEKESRLLRRPARSRYLTICHWLGRQKAGPKRRINQKKKATVIRQRNWICWSPTSQQAKRQPMGQCFILTCRKGPCTLSVKWNELVNYPPATGSTFGHFLGFGSSFFRCCLSISILLQATEPLGKKKAVRFVLLKLIAFNLATAIGNRPQWSNCGRPQPVTQQDARRHLLITRYRSLKKWPSPLLSKLLSKILNFEVSAN